MVDISAWQDQNNQYLAASLSWLRLRLERLTMEVPDHVPAAEPSAPATAPESSAADASPPVVGPSPGRFTWFRRRPSAVTTTPSSSASPSAPVLLLPSNVEEHIRLAAEERDKAGAMQPPPALVMLARQLQLTAFERDTLLLCAGVELDTRIAALCARAQGEPLRPYPTFALALSLLDDPSWDAISPYRPLRHWRLVEITQPPGTPLTVSALRADERIVNYIKGLNALDDRLGTVLTPMSGAPHLSTSQAASAKEVVRHYQRAPGSDRAPLIQLVGPDLASKELVARQATASSGHDLYSLSLADLASRSADTDLLARLWQRESLLLPLAAFIDAQGEENPESLRVLLHFLARCSDSNSILLLAVRDALPAIASSSSTIEVAKPTFEEQQAGWLDVLGDQHGAEQLASQFNFNLPEIDAFGGQVEELTADHVWALCCLKTRARLDTLAQRLEPKATWDDLVLPAEPLGLLQTIAQQVRQRARVYHDWGFEARMNRGMGISALFTGESGTGKTMAAEVIASDLNLNLYRIDLSAVVSKYIGETEKNLRQLFDAAEDGGSLLFFDEADALFGKRSEVKDSHDRYANIEINYLLQRMEAYGGLAILATNMKNAIDPAFMRRLRFVVNFAFPTAVERRLIWEKVFPQEMPRDDLDLDRLSRIILTGGNIQSIAVNAAFMAAAEDGKVTLPIVLAATRMELRKLDKPVNEVELRP